MVHKTVKKLMQKALSKLDSWKLDVARQTAIDVLEKCDIDHNKAFIRGV